MTFKMNSYLNEIIQDLKNWDTSKGELFMFGLYDVELRIPLDAKQLGILPENVEKELDTLCKEHNLIFHEDTTGQYLCAESNKNVVLLKEDERTQLRSPYTSKTLNKEFLEQELGIYTFKSMLNTEGKSIGVYEINSDFAPEEHSLNDNEIFQKLNAIKKGAALNANEICSILKECVEIRDDIEPSRGGYKDNATTLPDKITKQLNVEEEHLYDLKIKTLDILDVTTILVTFEIKTTKEDQKKFEGLKKQATKVISQSHNELLEIPILLVDNIHALFFDL